MPNLNLTSRKLYIEFHHNKPGALYGGMLIANGYALWSMVHLLSVQSLVLTSKSDSSYPFPKPKIEFPVYSR
ncbi:hypothetical protein HanHA300_Chr13g0499201 [Helianthus annuus]|nr:hypothetical protein HanHA300_Chr13g0499201 [Helianthus annuus]